MEIAESTRSRILNAAIEMMESGGESSVRLSAIAEAMGIKEPSIYHHFANRTELVNTAYIEWYWQCLKTDIPVEAMMVLVDSREDYIRAFRKSMEWSYQPERHHARAIRLSVLGAAQRNPELALAINDINRKFLATIADSVLVAQQKGWLRTDLDPMATAYWLHGQIIGRAVAEMDLGHIDLTKWDKVSFEAVLGLMLAPEK
ncbi:MAG: TetR/AcrR family transcriptional regulator [Ilumatobacteraceae bacterium]|nr:TetR/AcrR family transcriptional regulator [Ilumatobacteraceae bacterium]